MPREAKESKADGKLISGANGTGGLSFGTAQKLSCVLANGIVYGRCYVYVCPLPCIC